MVSVRGRTTASLIAEPEKGLLHVSRGNPCQNRYESYRLEGDARQGTTP
jgi:hypothetical protein